MSAWKERLSMAGLRCTGPRRAVMQVLQAAPVPLSPQEILTEGQHVHGNLGLVTVYRTLAVAEQLGCVRRVHREDGCHGYVACTPGHSHALICRECGQASEFPGGDDLSDLVTRVEADTGYEVDDHLLQLMGRCPRCRKKAGLTSRRADDVSSKCRLA